MTFFQAGYTSIIKSFQPKFGSGKFVHTPSTCINHTFPDCWALSWVSTEEIQKRKIMPLLQKSIDELHKEMDNSFNKDSFCWPNLFSKSSQMLEFNKKYFSDCKDLATIGLSFPEVDTPEILNYLTPGNSEGKPGIYKILNEKKESINSRQYGYDIIGLEPGGQFHSMHCNDLNHQYKEKFGIETNQYGLIDSYSECIMSNRLDQF